MPTPTVSGTGGLLKRGGGHRQHMTAGASEFGVDRVSAGDVDAFVGQGAVEPGGGELCQHGLVVDVTVTWV